MPLSKNERKMNLRNCKQCIYSNFLTIKKIRNRLTLFFQLILLILLPVISFSSCKSDINTPTAKNGVLDLRGIDLSTQKSIPLDGEWEFFYQQFIDPNTKNSDLPKYDSLMAVPGSWNGKEINGEHLPRFGYASYRLIVLTDTPDEEMGVRTGWCGTSYILFANGEKLTQSGIPNITGDLTTPAAKTNVLHFIPKSERIELIIHIANFNHRMGGINSSFKIGKFENIKQTERYTMSREIFIAGCLFFMGMFYLGQILINSRNRSLLYFSFFCLLMAIRIFTNGNLYIATFLPSIPWETIVKIDYLTLSFAPCFAALYFISLFPHKFSKGVAWTIFSVSLIHAVYVILTPPEIFSVTLIYFEIFILLQGLYSIGLFVRAMINLERDALILLPGLIAMVLCAVNDVLFSSRVIYTAYLSQWGLLIFTLFLSFVIARRSAIMQRTIEKQANLLHETHAQANVSRLGTILGLAKLAEYRDPDTGAHLERLQKYSKILLSELTRDEKYARYITPRYIRDIYDSIILHDIGKVGVPDAILLKPGKLSSDEFEIIKQHSVIGGDTICNIEAKVKMQSFLTLAREIAYSHHEKWNGTGYPYGLSKEEIPLSARICAVVDVYDALTSKRSYKDAFSHEKAVEIITEGKENHFDPDIIDAFLRCENQFDKIREKLQSKENYLLEIKRDPYDI